MRLWHKDLIAVLPKQQLLGQWRECCCIARNIKVNGTPNHLLVNKIMDYPIEHFSYYGCLVGVEMAKRGYNHHSDSFLKWQKKEDGTNPFPYPNYDDLFKGWHNDRYLLQCYYNLQEKFDCGGITEAEWRYFQEGVKAIMDEKSKIVPVTDEIRWMLNVVYPTLNGSFDNVKTIDAEALEILNKMYTSISFMDPCKGCKFDGLDPIDETGSAIPCISCQDGSKFERR